MWREGEGSKRVVRIWDWVDGGRVGRVEAGGRGGGGDCDIVVCGFDFGRGTVVVMGDL